MSRSASGAFTCNEGARYRGNQPPWRLARAEEMEHTGPGKANLLVRKKRLQDGASARLRLCVQRSGPQQIILAPWPHTIVRPVVFRAGAKTNEAAAFIISESSSEP